jgi:hypothetical protein
MLYTPFSPKFNAQWRKRREGEKEEEEEGW